MKYEIHHLRDIALKHICPFENENMANKFISDCNFPDILMEPNTRYLKSI